VQITGVSPARGREIERSELKKHAISLLSGRLPNALVDPWNRPAAGSPTLRLDLLPRDELMFLEQAIEWENLRAVHYPYFWATSSEWDDLANIESADPMFAQFMRAGSSRVVVPARPGFEDAVSFYVATLIPWGGVGAPAPDESGYLSIADEIQALTRPPKDGVQVGDSWEVHLPTDLTCLEADNLPTNDEASIPAPPEP
jgi:hypothetical protein